MAEFWTSTLWPLIIMVAESLLLLVVLLIAIAYILLADRKIWAAVQIRRGPNVVGPWGLFQSFADLLKFVLKEPIIPAGANKLKLPGADYLLHFALPNFYFHLTTAYDILRGSGVEIGKRNFMGAVPNLVRA